MPTIQENMLVFDVDYDWQNGGEEWSAPWGGSDAQWHTTILPRIHKYISESKVILEIGPGFGRWSQYLLSLCNRLILVDLSEKCIEACRKRFAQSQRIKYFVNDGTSLDFLPDASVDFVFSLDSLVHAEDDVIKQYVLQLPRVLRANGSGFIHHSNLGEYSSHCNLVNRIKRGKPFLEKLGLVEPICKGWRAPSMTATKFRMYVQASGMHCISQEIVNWNSRRLIDCFTVFRSNASGFKGSCKIVRNPRFMQEAEYVRWLSRIY